MIEIVTKYSNLYKLSRFNLKLEKAEYQRFPTIMN
jgi:hypothetical protein